MINSGILRQVSGHNQDAVKSAKTVETADRPARDSFERHFEGTSRENANTGPETPTDAGKTTDAGKVLAERSSEGDATPAPEVTPTPEITVSTDVEVFAAEDPDPRGVDTLSNAELSVEVEVPPNDSAVQHAVEVAVSTPLPEQPLQKAPVHEGVTRGLSPTKQVEKPAVAPVPVSVPQDTLEKSPTVSQNVNAALRATSPTTAAEGATGEKLTPKSEKRAPAEAPQHAVVRPAQGEVSSTVVATQPSEDVDADAADVTNKSTPVAQPAPSSTFPDNAARSAQAGTLDSGGRMRPSDDSDTVEVARAVEGNKQGEKPQNSAPVAAQNVTPAQPASAQRSLSQQFGQNSEDPGDSQRLLRSDDEPAVLSRLSGETRPAATAQTTVVQQSVTAAMAARQAKAVEQTESSKTVDDDSGAAEDSIDITREVGQERLIERAIHNSPTQTVIPQAVQRLVHQVRLQTQSQTRASAEAADRVAHVVESTGFSVPVEVIGLSQMLTEATFKNNKSNTQNVARRIAAQLGDAFATTGEKKVDVLLNPKELGRVKMQVETSETGVKITINAERPETSDLMRKHIEQLEREFHEMGFADVSFEFKDDNSSAQTTDQLEDEAVTEPTLTEVDEMLDPIQIVQSLRLGESGLDMRV